MSMNLVVLLYLVASVCFIQALKGLSHPTTSRIGNTFGMVGMAIAVATTVALIFKLGPAIAVGVFKNQQPVRAVPLVILGPEVRVRFNRPDPAGVVDLKPGGRDNLRLFGIKRNGKAVVKASRLLAPLFGRTRHRNFILSLNCAQWQQKKAAKQGLDRVSSTMNRGKRAHGLNFPKSG